MPTKKVDYSEPQLLSCEDPKEFEAVAASIRKRFEIIAVDNAYLIADMANCDWRLRRLEKIKACMIEMFLSGETPPEVHERHLKAVHRSMRIAKFSYRWTLDMLLFFKSREEARQYAESKGETPKSGSFLKTATTWYRTINPPRPRKRPSSPAPAE